jgi:ribosomal protein S18 acetylase RimI-like enzyme
VNPRLVYRSDETPEPGAIAALYRAARLVRPEGERLRRMFEGSNVVLSCWEDRDDTSQLVGLLRGWTDYAFNGYICDLAVHPEHQRRGIGKELLDRATGLGAPEVMWILRALPDAAAYYGHLGWQKVEDGWMRPRGE